VDNRPCIADEVAVYYRKSMDLSWDGEETSTSVDGEGRSAEGRDPTPPPRTEVAVELSLEEATLVEGMCTARLVVIVRGSRSL
jgi:hypothetical protein